MTVNELRELLKDIDGRRIVILSRDGEGNHFSPLADLIDSMAYHPTTPYSGETGLEELTESDMAAGYTEDDVITGQPAPVLYPLC